MRYRGRKWNNILMLSVILFIAVLNLPTLIKHFLIEPSESPYPYLLNPSREVQALYTSQWSLELQESTWVSTPEGAVPAEEYIQRWVDVVGTAVDEQTYDSLSANLRNPQTIEVWYVDQEEPQRLTYYQTPQFWLLKNWQNHWIAVSVEPGYLLP